MGYRFERYKLTHRTKRMSETTSASIERMERDIQQARGWLAEAEAMPSMDRFVIVGLQLAVSGSAHSLTEMKDFQNRFDRRFR